MSVFSFPRLNIKGLIRVDVGTANNDDYSNTALPGRRNPDGSPVLLRLADSKNVQAVTFGMSDPDWIAWVQKSHVFDVVPPPPPPAPPTLKNKAEGSAAPAAAATTTTQIPAEWNYYGSMAFDLGFANGGTSYDAKVIGVQYADRTAADDPLVGTVLSFRNRPDPKTGRGTAMLIDVNPESVPCSQVFAGSLLLQQGDEALMLGKPSKGVTRWINFQRNTNLPGPNGAGCGMQCVVPVEELKGQPILDFFAQGQPLPANFKGVVFRYYIGRSLQELNTLKYSPAEWRAKIEALYAKKGKNPSYLEVVGTVAPWYDGEMQSLAAGRLLVPTDKTIPVPKGSRGNGPQFLLAPATFQVNADLGIVSVDLSGTFPDQYTGTTFDPFETGNNPKFDFGEVRLVVRQGTLSLDLGPIPYQDTDAGDRKGWVFDFPTAKLTKDQLQLIADGDFFVTSPKYGDLLAEQRYLIASDQSCVFGEQDLSPNATTDQFMNDGPSEVPATIRVYDKGRELSGTAAPKIAVWEYDTTPNQDNKNGRQLPGTFAPASRSSCPAPAWGIACTRLSSPARPRRRPRTA